MMGRVFGCLWMLSLLLASASGGERPVLRVGMDTRAYPWCYVPGLDYSKEDQGQPPAIIPAQVKQLVGLDIDVLHALARRLTADVEIVPMSWFELEKGLVAGRYDLLLSSWTPSPSTPEEIAASPPYVEWGLLVVVRTDSPVRAYADLDAGRVGHYDDPSVARALKSLAGGRFRTYRDATAMFADLKGGALDGVIYDSTYVRRRVADDASFRVLGAPLNRLGYHVGVRTSDAALRARVATAIHAAVAAGEMERIRRKWESAEVPRPEPRVSQPRP
jgi:ABC-type amino acid transport substrate-binding protein